MHNIGYLVWLKPKVRNRICAKIFISKSSRYVAQMKSHTFIPFWILCPTIRFELVINTSRQSQRRKRFDNEYGINKP